MGKSVWFPVIMTYRLSCHVVCVCVCVSYRLSCCKLSKASYHYHPLIHFDLGVKGGTSLGSWRLPVISAKLKDMFSSKKLLGLFTVLTLFLDRLLILQLCIIFII